jgi:hypothetical protein
MSGSGSKRTPDRQRGRFLHGWPPIRSAEKRSQRPDDYRLVSEDAPNRSWTDSIWKAAATFLCINVALLIVGQPLQRATALQGTTQRDGGRPPAQAPTQCEAGNRLERHFRGEFRPRVIVAGSTPAASCRVTDVARISSYSPRLRESWDAEVDFRRAAPAADHRCGGPNSRCRRFATHFLPPTYVRTRTFIPSVSIVICPSRSVL